LKTLSYAGDLGKSGAEQVQEWARGANVKAFNTVFAQNMSTGKVKDEPLSLLVAGDDTDAKGQVLDLARPLVSRPWT
jgi:predicted dinucleotide-binding enzyme